MIANKVGNRIMKLRTNWYQNRFHKGTNRMVINGSDNHRVKYSDKGGNIDSLFKELLMYIISYEGVNIS